jgi:hypothetical protein
MTAGFVALLGIGAAVGAFFVGRVGPADRAERAEGQLARALEELRVEQLGQIQRAPSLVRKLRMIDELAGLQAARAFAVDPDVQGALVAVPVDRQALERAVDRGHDDRTRTVYVVDASGAVAASREVTMASGAERAQIAGADGRVGLAAVAAALRARLDVSEVVILPPERAVQLTVVSIVEPESDTPLGAIVLVEDLIEYITVDMEQLGGYLIYFDDKTVIESGPPELAQALGGDVLKEARAQAARLGSSGTPVEVASGARKFLATIVELPRVSGRPLPPEYPPEGTYVLFAVDVFDPDPP